MIVLSQNVMRRCAALVLAFAALMHTQVAWAQAEIIDWDTAGVPNLTGVPNPTTVTGSDGTTATVNYGIQTSGAGAVTATYGDYLSYYTGDIGGTVGPLLLNFDNSSFDPNDKVTTTFTMSQSVKGLTFTLSDIDQATFRDAIEVYYDNGNGTFVNAALTAAFWTANSTVLRTNDGIVNGWTGNGSSGTTATNGNLAFNFGNTAVRRIRIVYFSYTGTGDPTGQFTGISDFRYNTPGADLSLTKTAITPTPTFGGNATFRLSLTNASSSSQTATNVVVRDSLPAGFSFSSASGTGSFNQSTGDWTVPSIAPGQTRTIDLTGTVTATAGATVTNTAEVFSSNRNDPDSTPNNGVTSEDDYASASFTVAGTRAAGTPPVLSCPNSNVIFDWDAIAWTAGSTSNSYPLGTLGNISFTLTNPGLWLNNAAVGGQSPTRQNFVHGGTFQNSLLELVDLPNTDSVVTTAVDLPAIMQGVQFSIFDVDYAPGQFADRVEVVGERGGVTVLPTLTNGVANYVIGNEAFGDGNSDSDQPDGTVIVTFSDPIDRIIIRYGNHSLSPANPGQQGVSIHDFNFCNPYTELSATKVSSVLSDPVNGSTNPRNIPGALIEYAIGVSNTGISPVDDGTVSLADIVPSETKMCVTDIGGNGPVVFTDGNPSSNLTYTYTGLTNTADDLDFSSDGGATWGYAPVADADGCDTEITHFRVQPSGAFAASGSFTLNARFIVE